MTLDAILQLQEQRVRRVVASMAPLPHTTPATASYCPEPSLQRYRHYGCRCRRCRSLHREWCENLRLRRRTRARVS